MHFLIASTFLSGLAVMMTEMSFLRLASATLGSSIGVTGALIAMVLGAYALGSGLASVVSGTRRLRALVTSAFIGAGLAIVLCSTAGAGLFEATSAAASAGGAGRQALMWLLLALVLSSPMLPLALVGPAAVERAVRRGLAAGRASGIAYASGTLGSLAGTLIACLWLLPAFGAVPCLQGLACLSVISGVGFNFGHERN